MDMEAPVYESLAAYLSAAGHTYETFAKLVGVTPGAIGHWANGRFSAREEHALKVQQVTAGQVPAWVVRPALKRFMAA
jgi:DNA-binding transcriptional regulator YdaS (Cro superfamily)